MDKATLFTAILDTFQGKFSGWWWWIATELTKGKERTFFRISPALLILTEGLGRRKAPGYQNFGK